MKREKNFLFQFSMQSIPYDTVEKIHERIITLPKTMHFVCFSTKVLNRLI